MDISELSGGALLAFRQANRRAIALPILSSPIKANTAETSGFIEERKKAGCT